MYSPVLARKVELLLKLMTYVMNEGVFAVHGGTAINLFVKNMPRYSVDIGSGTDMSSNISGTILPYNGNHLISLILKSRIRANSNRE